VIHNKSGCEKINFPEVAEGSTQVVTLVVRYPENRAALNSFGTLGSRVSVDFASNISKNSSRDLKWKITRSTRSTGNGSI